MGERSNCSIERLGSVVAQELPFVTLEVNGKLIRVPAMKVAPLAKLGDKLKWNGSIWDLVD
ncbi:hypothetical protein PAECIP111893_00826 [Paenibacillus plantiphilus]|uniref:Copper amine oxidase-like N-terminal domain-containing protein n=1 Tax=Paenibacillus plantiphilus TaxID=2905650 RepID=A0ABN8G2G8_9BACL|nr:hypothetical protein [Paenibacillus plantiphilus]CAH1197573.1 hypothetical protein PAECIP111893_00826 [Paenibacillus plantiphilus]